MLQNEESDIISTASGLYRKLKSEGLELRANHGMGRDDVLWSKLVDSLGLDIQGYAKSRY